MVSTWQPNGQPQPKASVLTKPCTKKRARERNQKPHPYFIVRTVLRILERIKIQVPGEQQPKKGRKKRSGARTAQETPREVAGNEVTTALRLRSGAGTGAHNGDFSSCGLSYQNTRGEEGHRPIRRFGSSNKGERLVVH
jgi:hypothetical protein